MSLSVTKWGILKYLSAENLSETTTTRLLKYEYKTFLTDKERMKNSKIRTKSFNYLHKETKWGSTAYEADKIF